MAQPPTAGDDGIVTRVSPRPVADTVARLTDMVTARGMRVFAVIDQQAAAREVGLDLRATTAVLFGSPRAGTPVMAAAPLSALDLPLKVVVWADAEAAQVSYYSPAALARRYGLTADLAAGLAGVDALVEELVAP
jgi:uncharacterized protein (DUF302 family)